MNLGTAIIVAWTWASIAVAVLGLTAIVLCGVLPFVLSLKRRKAEFTERRLANR